MSYENNLLFKVGFTEVLQNITSFRKLHITLWKFTLTLFWQKFRLNNGLIIELTKWECKFCHFQSYNIFLWNYWFPNAEHEQIVSKVNKITVSHYLVVLNCVDYVVSRLFCTMFRFDGKMTAAKTKSKRDDGISSWHTIPWFVETGTIWGPAWGQDEFLRRTMCLLLLLGFWSITIIPRQKPVGLWEPFSPSPWL